MKIHLAGAELFHVDRRRDGQIDMTKLIVAFRNSENTSQNKSVHAGNINENFSRATGAYKPSQ
jgi:hypothetical protein